MIHSKMKKYSRVSLAIGALMVFAIVTAGSASRAQTADGLTPA
jgi:hypothetical protein